MSARLTVFKLSFPVDFGTAKEGVDANGGLEETTGGNRPPTGAPLGCGGEELYVGGNQDPMTEGLLIVLVHWCAIACLWRTNAGGAWHTCAIRWRLLKLPLRR